MDELSDSALVALAKAGEAPAFAQLYARHFAAVYDFAACLTRDRDETEAIARDSFAVAMDALAGLHKGVTFRAWLFAIARKHTLDTLARQARPAPPLFANEPDVLHQIDTSRLASPDEDAEAVALAAIVWQAAAALDPKQLSLLDLHLRHDLGVNEIADVMGVNRKNSEVMLTRLKAAAANSISAFVAREGADGAALVPPLAVFAALAELPAPSGLADEILADLMLQWPERAAVPAGATFALPPAGGRRFFDRQSAGRLFGVLGIVAVLLLVLLLVPASPIALTRADGQELVQAQSENPTASAAASASDTRVSNAAVSSSPLGTRTTSGSITASPTATATPTITADSQVVGGPSATSTPSPTPSPNPSATSTPKPSPTSPPPAPTPTGTAVPCRPSIGTASITDLTVALGGRSNFPLFNQAFCANVIFTAAVADGAPWLSLDSTGTTIPAGHSATVNVSINAALVPTTEGLYSGTLILSGPYNTVRVSVTTQRGGQPPQIASHSATCSAVPGAVSFQASVIDDIGVTAVAVSYTLADGQTGSQALRLSGGVWGTSFTVSSAITSYSLIASDAGEHQSAAVTGFCQ